MRTGDLQCFLERLRRKFAILYIISRHHNSRVLDTVAIMNGCVVTALETRHTGRCSTSLLALCPSFLPLVQWPIILNFFFGMAREDSSNCIFEAGEGYNCIEVKSKRVCHIKQ